MPKLTGITLEPGPHLIVAPSQRQQVAVTARYADGTTRDVTRLTVFTSSDEAVAQVDRNGLVAFQRPGQTAILARYLDELAPVLLTYIDPESSQPWTNPPTNNYVDTHLFAKQKLLGLALRTWPRTTNSSAASRSTSAASCRPPRRCADSSRTRAPRSVLDSWIACSNARNMPISGP